MSTADTAVARPAWVEAAFKGLCALVYRALATRARIDIHTARLVEPHLKERMAQWRRAWGYESADLPAASRAGGTPAPQTAALLRHCLTFHAREMLVQLQEEAQTAGNQEVPQDEADKALAAALLQKLERAEAEAARICREQGVQVG